MIRREFIQKSAQWTSALFLASLFNGCASSTKKSPTIHKIELFRYDVTIPRYFSWGTWLNRQQVFMKISAGDYYGWAEVAGSKNNPDLDLKEWGAFLPAYKGLTVYQAYDRVKSKQISSPELVTRNLEFLEMALLDIIGRMEEKPAIELLDMKGRKPVPGLFCILNHQPDKIAEYITSAKEQNLHHFMKFKMYGDEKTDLAIIKQARHMLDNQSYIISDANRGYKKWHTLDELAAILLTLQDYGLSGMEDPAELTSSQWIDLQSKLVTFALIPDRPMRPAWEGLHNMQKGMGKIYNLHPESMGSLHHLTQCADKIESFDAGVMIGDASLVGPACNVWQQIAIGLGARWVEAIEKSDESASYLKCIKSKPTFRDASGQFAYKSAAGFGLELDEQLLAEICRTKAAL